MNNQKLKEKDKKIIMKNNREEIKMKKSNITEIRVEELHDHEESKHSLPSL